MKGSSSRSSLCYKLSSIKTHICFFETAGRIGQCGDGGVALDQTWTPPFVIDRAATSQRADDWRAILAGLGNSAAFESTLAAQVASDTSLPPLANFIPLPPAPPSNIVPDGSGFVTLSYVTVAPFQPTAPTATVVTDLSSNETSVPPQVNAAAGASMAFMGGGAILILGAAGLFAYKGSRNKLRNFITGGKWKDDKVKPYNPIIKPAPPDTTGKDLFFNKVDSPTGTTSLHLDVRPAIDPILDPIIDRKLAPIEIPAESDETPRSWAFQREPSFLVEDDIRLPVRPLTTSSVGSHRSARSAHADGASAGSLLRFPKLRLSSGKLPTLVPQRSRISSKVRPEDMNASWSAATEGYWEEKSTPGASGSVTPAASRPSTGVSGSISRPGTAARESVSPTISRPGTAARERLERLAAEKSWTCQFETDWVYGDEDSGKLEKTMQWLPPLEHGGSKSSTYVMDTEDDRDAMNIIDNKSSRHVLPMQSMPDAFSPHAPVTDKGKGFASLSDDDSLLPNRIPDPEDLEKQAAIASSDDGYKTYQVAPSTDRSWTRSQPGSYWQDSSTQTPKGQQSGVSTPAFSPPDMSTLQSALAAFVPADNQVSPPHFVPDPQESRERSHASAGVPLDRWSQRAAPGLDSNQALQERLDQETGVSLREGCVGRIPSRPSSHIRPPKMPATSSSPSPSLRGTARQTQDRRPSPRPDRDAAAVMSLMSPEACKACGNIFMADSVYCRKCGANRHEEEVMSSSARMLEVIMKSARSSEPPESMTGSEKMLETLMADSPHGSKASSWGTGMMQEKFDNWDGNSQASVRTSPPVVEPALPTVDRAMQMQTMSDWSAVASMQATRTMDAAIESRPASSVWGAGWESGPSQDGSRMGTSQGNWRPSPSPIMELRPPLSKPTTEVSARSASAATAWSEPDDVNQLSTHSWGNSRPPSRATVSAPARNESEELAMMAASQSSWVSRGPPTSAQSVDQALITDCSVWRDMPAGLRAAAAPSSGSSAVSNVVSDAAWSRSPEFTEYTTQQDQEWVSAERRAAIESSLQENTLATADGAREASKQTAHTEVSAWDSPKADQGSKSADATIRPSSACSVWSESPEIATEWLNTKKQAAADVDNDPYFDAKSPAAPDSARQEELLVEAEASAFLSPTAPQQRPSFLNPAFSTSQESFGHFSLASPPSRRFEKDPTSPTFMREESFDGPSPPPPVRPARNPSPPTMGQALRHSISPPSRSRSPQDQAANPFSLPSLSNPYNMRLMPVRIPPLPEPLLRPSSGGTDFTGIDPVTASKRRRVNADSARKSASPTDRSSRSGLSGPGWGQQAESQWDEFNMMSGRIPAGRTGLTPTHKMAPLRTHPALAVDVEAGNLGNNPLPPTEGDNSHQAAVPVVPGFFNLPNIAADTAASHQWGMSPLLDLPPISDPGDTTARSWAQSVEADVWD